MRLQAMPFIMIEINSCFLIIQVDGAASSLLRPFLELQVCYYVHFQTRHGMAGSRGNWKGGGAGGLASQAISCRLQPHPSQRAMSRTIVTLLSLVTVQTTASSPLQPRTLKFRTVSLSSQSVRNADRPADLEQAAGRRMRRRKQKPPRCVPLPALTAPSGRPNGAGRP